MHDAAADSLFVDIVRLAAARGASDIHLTGGIAPTARILGRLQALPLPALDESAMDAIRARIAAATGGAVMDRASASDHAVDVDGVGRVRLHLFRQRRSLAIAVRLVPGALPPATPQTTGTWEERAANLQHGLVLVCGPTGSGKSTTLAMLVDRINRTRDVHIVTIEDPIEYLHRPQRALVTQRELHTDTESFHEALRNVLRQDPDVVLIGEIRDRDTLAAALTVAETGHLVLSSLHTGSAAQAVHRVIDFFPPADQGPIRTQLAAVLQMVVAQRLLPRADASGRIAVQELLPITPAIRNLIREGKTHQIDNAMQLGHAASGTRPLQHALLELQHTGVIDSRDAIDHAPDPDAMRTALAASRPGAGPALGN